jgi:hypothetical protein
MMGPAANRWQHKVLTTEYRTQWRLLVDSAQCRDVFFAPEYIIPFERHSGETAQLFVFGDDENYIAYPFFLRRINDLSFYGALPLDDETVYFDIVSPYGYSGPLPQVVDKNCEWDLWQSFLSTFHGYCRDSNIISEFARLNPFVSNHRQLQELTDGVQASNQITVLDLTRSEEELWRGFNRGNRSNINKAKRSGVEVRKHSDRDAVERFYELYLGTMARNRADRWYDFSLGLFIDHFEMLDDRISLFCAHYEGEIVAAASFLHDGDVVHYFLGGSHRDYFSMRPNNLLMYEVILWAKGQGYQCFNLGGGYDEGLARFKNAFSKQSTDFYVYRTIHDAFTYDALCRRHEAFASGTPRHDSGQAEENHDYFPRYRAGS